MKPRIVSHQVSSELNQKPTIKNSAPTVTPPKKKNRKQQSTINNQSSMSPGSSEENTQTGTSIPGLVGGIFKFLSTICKNAADKQMQEGKKSSAYYAARFFEYLFDTVSFLTSTISSWISNPSKILEDFSKVIDFFKNLWNKLVEWWNGVTGKKAEPEKPKNDVVQEKSHQPVEPGKPSPQTRPENSHHLSQQHTQSMTAAQSHAPQSDASQSNTPQSITAQPAASQHEATMSSMTLIYSTIGRPAPGNTAAKSNDIIKDEKDEYDADLHQTKAMANDVMANNSKTTSADQQEIQEIEEEQEVVASFRMR